MAKTLLVITIFISSAPFSHADVVFNFDTNPVNELTPFTDTVNGLSATFSGPGAVCDVSGLFVSLSGNALIQDFCQSTGSGAQNIAFSQNVRRISFDFGTSAFTGIDTLTLRAFENGTAVGTVNFVSSVPPGSPFGNGEGVATFSGLFNSTEFFSDTNSGVALDNIAVVTTTVPEPGSLWFIVIGTALFCWTCLCSSRRRGNSPPEVYQCKQMSQLTS